MALNERGSSAATVFDLNYLKRIKRIEREERREGIRNAGTFKIKNGNQRSLNVATLDLVICKEA